MYSVILRWLLWGGALLALLLPTGSSTGRAMAASLSDAVKTENAQKLMQQGQAALQAGNVQSALQRFEQSYLIAQLPELLYWLGATAQQQHRDQAAADLFRRYLAAMEDAVNPSVRAEIDRFLGTVAVSQNELDVISGDVGAVLRVDGRVAGVLPLTTPLLLTPTGHRFSIEKNRRSFETNLLQIPSGQRVHLQLALASRYAVLTVATGVALLVVPSSVSSDVKTQLMQLLGPAVSQAHGFLIAREQTEQALQRVGAPLSGQCAERLDCQERLAKLLDASQVLTVSILPSLDAPKTLRIQLFDMDTGSIAAAEEQECAACTAESLKQRAITLAQTVLKAAWDRGRGSLSIGSEPSGATVESLGKELGKTPLVREAFEGPVDLDLKLDGYVPQRFSLKVLRGQQTVFSSVLQKAQQPTDQGPPEPQEKPPSVRAPVRRPLWRFIGGGAVTGVGLLLGSFGLSALAANGTCVDAVSVPGGVCNQIRDTDRPAGALLGVGGTLTIVGVSLLVLPL
jgi:hypothetical protein